MVACISAVEPGRRNGRTPMPSGRLDDGLWLPAQQPPVQEVRVLVAVHVAQVGQVQRLGVDEGMEGEIAGAELVVVNCQVGVEFAGDALEAAARGGVQQASLSVCFDHDGGQVCQRVIEDFAQAAA